MAPLLPLILLIGFPIAEIYTFIQVGHWLGGLATLGLVLASMVAGVALMRWQGLSLMPQIQASLQRGEPLAKPVLRGMAFLLAGLFLVIPGFLSDLLAIALLLPPTRWILLVAGMALFARGKVSVHAQAAGVHFESRSDFTADPFGPRQASHGPQDIDGEYRDVTPEDPPSSPGSSQRLPPP